MESYKQVTQNEADAYKIMKEDLGFKQDKELLDYIKVKTITNYNEKNLIVAFHDSDDAKKKSNDKSDDKKKGN